MFILSIITAIIIGYICRGSLTNLTSLRIQGIIFVFIGFGVEVIAKFLIKTGVIELGLVSYILHLATYVFLFIMVYKNWEKYSLRIIGVGFLLNAVVIFSNDGIMPVGQKAMNYLGIPLTQPLEGMYKVMESDMVFKFLGDILPIHLKKVGFILSFGDLFIMLGIMIILIQGMRRKENNV